MLLVRLDGRRTSPCPLLPFVSRRARPMGAREPGSRGTPRRPLEGRAADRRRRRVGSMTPRPDGAPEPPAEIRDYYANFPEEQRLRSGAFQLEFERTKDVLTRVLPRPPCRLLDVGGGAGAYSFWLAARNYEVHLLDAS